MATCASALCIAFLTTAVGLTFLVAPICSTTKYLNYFELRHDLRTLEQSYPNLARNYDIGPSFQGRGLYVLQISKDVGVRVLGKPAFKYVANIHGNEAVGRQMLMYLANHLLFNYGKDPRVTALVDNTDIHLMPSMNPDGFEMATEGDCDGVDGLYNWEGVDLNQNFPEQFPLPIYGSRPQQETKAVMKWLQRQPNFVLSASLNGGALVASYPFDSSEKHQTSGFHSATPDNGIFTNLAQTYAFAHPKMRLNTQCGGRSNFSGGVTNGAYWNEMTGGMQDYNYLHSNTFEISLYISCCKYPHADTLPGFWDDNLESLLQYMEMTHSGVRGIITDADGMPIAYAEISLNIHRLRATKASDRGEYWRLLTAGRHTIVFSAPGYAPKVKIVDVPHISQGYVKYDVVLARMDGLGIKC